MIALVLAAALGAGDDARAVQARQCLESIQRAMTNPVGHCSDDVRRYLVEDDLRGFISGKRSAIAELIEWFGKRGELDALAEALRKRASFVSTDGYGKVRWGSSPAQVRKAYPAAKTDPKGRLFVTGDVVDFPASTYFLFAGDKLVRVVIAFAREHSYTNAEGHVRDFERVAGLLAQKYGDSLPAPEPSAGDEQSPLAEMYEAMGGTGRAVGSGAREIRMKWQAKQTAVELVLSGYGGEISHQILYSSVELAALFDVAETGRLLGDL